MISTNFFNRATAWLLALAASSLLSAQSNVITVNTPMKVSGKRGESVAVKLAVQIKDGYHINSDKPADEYMIPLRLTWDKAAVQADSIVFPAPRQEKYAFADKPLSVYTGGFEIVSKLKVLEPKAQDGMGLLTAKLRYQACTETMCLPPKTVDIKIPFEVR